MGHESVTDGSSPIPTVQFEDVDPRAKLSELRQSAVGFTAKLNALRDELRELPASRELSLALTKLDEAELWVNALMSLSCGNTNLADEAPGVHELRQLLLKQPPCRERSVALTKLDEAGLWLSAAKCGKVD